MLRDVSFRAGPPSAAMIQSARPPGRSLSNTMRRPSGEIAGSKSSAVSRTAWVSGTASPPLAGMRQSCPSRSMTSQRPSGEASNDSRVASVVSKEMVSVRGWVTGETNTARPNASAWSVLRSVTTIVALPSSRIRFSIQLQKPGIRHQRLELQAPHVEPEVGATGPRPLEHLDRVLGPAHGQQRGGHVARVGGRDVPRAELLLHAGYLGSGLLALPLGHEIGRAH